MNYLIFDVGDNIGNFPETNNGVPVHILVQGSNGACGGYNTIATIPYDKEQCLKVEIPEGVGLDSETAIFLQGGEHHKFNSGTQILTIHELSKMLGDKKYGNPYILNE